MSWGPPDQIRFFTQLPLRTSESLSYVCFYGCSLVRRWFWGRILPCPLPHFFNPWFPSRYSGFPLPLVRLATHLRFSCAYCGALSLFRLSAPFGTGAPPHFRYIRAPIVTWVCPGHLVRFPGTSAVFIWEDWCSRFFYKSCSFYPLETLWVIFFATLCTRQGCFRTSWGTYTPLSPATDTVSIDYPRLSASW